MDTVIVKNTSKLPIVKLFDTSVSVKILPTGNIGTVHVAWFGKNQAAIQKAINACPRYGTVMFDDTAYSITSGFSHINKAINMDGNGAILNMPSIVYSNII